MKTSPQRILPKPKLPAQRIAFYGPMAVGKTFCAKYISESGYMRRSFASKLKALAYDLYGVQGKADWERKILQEVGTDLRKHDDAVFIKYLLKEIKYSVPNNRVVIDDLRFIPEADWLRKNDFTLVQVTCNEGVRFERILKLYPDLDSSRLSHSGELEWMHIKPDYVIDSTDPGVVTDLERILTNVAYSTSR